METEIVMTLINVLVLSVGF